MSREDSVADIIESVKRLSASDVTRLREGLAIVEESVRSEVVEILHTPEPEKRLITFQEAATLLQREAGFDLEKARNEMVESHRRWGLFEAVIKKGLAQDEQGYRALFNAAEFREGELKDLIKRLKRGESWTPIFSPGGLTLKEMWEVLIQQAGIPFWDNGYVHQHLSELRIIGPSEVQDLDTLDSKPWEEQQKRFQEAYNKAPPGREAKPTITFTPDQAKETKLSATRQVQQIAKGKHVLTLTDNLLLWRERVDRRLTEHRGKELATLSPDDYRKALVDALKKKKITLPHGREKITQSPLEVFPDGSVVVFFWAPAFRELHLIGNPPPSAEFCLGARLALG